MTVKFPRFGLPAATPFSLWRVALVALLIQTILLSYTYATLIFNPGEYLIIDHFDGIKNYFSMACFLRQPLGSALVQGHNYPFGEYIYYTDSTPLVVVPLHWLVLAVPALAPYGLYLYDLFILSGFVVATGFLVLILRRLAVPGWLTVLLAVCLPWLGPQTLRLQVGHMNLTYTPALLFIIWALQRLHEAWREQKSLVRPFGVVLLGIVFFSWLHFYYLPLLGGTLAFFGTCLLYESWRTRRPWRRLAIGLGATLLAAVALTAGLLQLFDARAGERTPNSNGYDWIEWKLQFSALFAGYVYNKIRFPFERTAVIQYESDSYLTSFVLFGLLLVAILALFRRLPATVSLSQLRQDRHYPFVKYMLVAGLAMALIALGETIDVDNGSYLLHNYLNAFFWLHKLTARITQFRALGRFVWPFWWAVVLAFSWYAAQWRSVPGLRWALGMLCIFLIVDTVNATHFYAKYTQRANLLTQPAATAPVQQLLNWVDSRRYQAILPIPYYHSGTEWHDEPSNLNVDPDDPHCNTTYQLAMVSGLPLMAHKATRAISSDATQLYSIFKPSGPDPALLAKLDQRPVLVFLDTAYYDGRNNYYRDGLRERPTTRAIYERGPDFIRENHLRRIRHQGSWSLYEWFPKGQPAPTPAR